MARGMARVRLMPRLLGLAAAAVASLLIAQSAMAQGSPQSVPATVYGFNCSVMVDGAPADGATIMAMIGEDEVSATWDPQGWAVTVPANAMVMFTVNGNAAMVNGEDSLNSGDEGSLVSAMLEASTAPPPAEEEDTLTPSTGDAMPSEGEEDTLVPAGEGDAMPSEEEDTLTPAGGDAMPSEGDAMPSEGDAMPSEGSAMPSGGTGGLLNQGNGADAWAFGLGGGLVLLGLLGAFAAHRSTRKASEIA